jgi:hypothetical protein
MYIMKRVFIVLFVLCSTADTTIASSKFELRLGGGVSKISKPQLYTDYRNLGPSVTSGISFQMTSRLGILISVDFNRYIFDRSRLHEELVNQGLLTSSDQIKGGNSQIISISANTLLYIIPKSGILPLYLIGGGGYFKLSKDEMSTGGVVTPKQTKFAWHLLSGIGIDVPVSGALSLFLEGKYGVGYTKPEKSHFMTGSFGVKFDR